MNTTLKCLLLDDELPGLMYLKMLCEQIPELEVVKAFNSSKTFLEETHSLDFDICILDIEMPEMSGLQVAELLKGKPVIFTTAYKEYAVDAFDLNAIDYVLKPIKRERLQLAVQKAISALGHSVITEKCGQFNSEKGKVLLYFNRVKYIKVSETDSRDKTVYLNDNKTLVLKNISFEELLKSLPPDQFCRINKKEVIALRIVQYFSHNEIITDLIEAGKPLAFTLTEVYRVNFMNRVSRK